jgi:hypothetical protein
MMCLREAIHIALEYFMLFTLASDHDVFKKERKEQARTMGVIVVCNRMLVLINLGLKKLRSLSNGSEEVDSTKIQQVAQETAQKCSSMMQTNLGPDPDSSEAIEFLCLAEGGEVTHYEVLAAMSKKLNGEIKNTRKLSTTVNSILREEKRLLALCTKLAKQTATSK